MNVEGIIQEDWASEPSVMEACLRVWNELSSRPYQLDHYTFGDLHEMSKATSESSVSTALLYLANPRLKVLKICLMYEFNGNVLELPDDEVQHFSRGEPVFHPEFGEAMKESEILMCFTPGARLHRVEGDA